MMFKQAITGNGKAQSYGQDSIVTKTLKKSKIMQDTVDVNVKKFQDSRGKTDTFKHSVSL